MTHGPNGTASWRIVVTNTGLGALNNVTVSDAQAPGCQVAPFSLDAGASRTVECTSTDLRAGFTNTASVSADGSADASGLTATGTDTASVTVSPTRVLSVAKSAPGVATGAPLTAGTPVTWNYKVTNSGNQRVDDVKVADDKGVAVSCPKTSLGMDESMVCTGTGPVG